MRLLTPKELEDRRRDWEKGRSNMEQAYQDDPRVYKSCKVDRCAIILVICSFLLGLCCVGLV